jgi:3,4-dihydroxy 2-butanone 4-phosphate synthase/GTP cyclohydrolase II
MSAERKVIHDALSEIRKGRIVIVVDDEERENEGDFMIAAQLATPEAVNFMLKEGRGVLCVALTSERCRELELPLMLEKCENTSFHETAFTVSVDFRGKGCTTGASAHDRAATIRALAAPKTKPHDLGRPGHIFPLQAHAEGLIGRPGHTEAAVELARLAGFEPAAALIEILNEDGSMARGSELAAIASRFDLTVVSVEQIRMFLKRSSTEAEKPAGKLIHIEA